MVLPFWNLYIHVNVTSPLRLYLHLLGFAQVKTSASVWTSGRNVKIINSSKNTRKAYMEEKSAYKYNINRTYQSVNSSLHLLSVNHLFGDCAENRSLELFTYDIISVWLPTGLYAHKLIYVFIIWTFYQISFLIKVNKFLEIFKRQGWKKSIIHFMIYVYNDQGLVVQNSWWQ